MQLFFFLNLFSFRSFIYVLFIPHVAVLSWLVEAHCFLDSKKDCKPILPFFWVLWINLLHLTFPYWWSREKELRPLVRDDYRVKITTQKEYGQCSSISFLAVSLTVVLILLSVSVALKVYGEADRSWHLAQILNRCVLQKQSTRSLDLLGADVVFSTECLVVEAGGLYV